MPTRRRFERWLSPEALQPDGSLWPPDVPVWPQKHVERFETRTRPRRRRPATCPFSPRERAFIRARLLVLERQPEGVEAGFWANCAHHSHGTIPDVTRGLIVRGLLRLEFGKRPRCYFTPAGLAALEVFFRRQRAEFRMLFPRLHANLSIVVAADR